MHFRSASINCINGPQVMGARVFVGAFIPLVGATLAGVLAALIALTAGTILAGIIGAILSVPLTAVTWAAIKAWNEYDDDQISAGTIEQAEYETLLDETGHGISTLPDGEIPQLPVSGTTPVGTITGEGAGSDRPGTASRIDASDTGAS